MTRSQRGDAASVRGNASGTHTRGIYGTNLHAFVAILERITAACRDDQGPAVDRESVAKWEDDQYVYFGTCLSDIEGDIDMNVHEGRLMVRLAKLADDSDLD
jgi:hypothetical protein